MLSSRQQHCLRGMGIARWRERDAVDLDNQQEALVDEPLSPQDLADISQFIGANESAAQPPQSVSPQAAKPTTPTVELPPLDNWDTVIDCIAQCNACELAQHCTQKVPGVGDRLLHGPRECL